MAATKVNINGINEIDFPSTVTAKVTSPGVVTLTNIGPTVIILTAGENISAYQVVTVHVDGKAYKADAGTVADADRIAGLAITSALTGATLQIQQIGPVNNLGWSFIPGASVYLGLTGSLVQTPNTGLFELPMGTALSAVDLELQMGLPIIFA